MLYRNLLNYYTLFIIAEVLDYGYPQKTDTGILKTYITQTGIRTQVRSVFFVTTSNSLPYMSIIMACVY